jgi:hypothetical protein
MCPSLLDLCSGAAMMSACPLPPLHLLKDAAPGTGAPPGRLDPAARPGTSLSAAELRAWEHLVRDLSRGTSENSQGPER